MNPDLVVQIMVTWSVLCLKVYLFVTGSCCCWLIICSCKNTCCCCKRWEWEEPVGWAWPLLFFCEALPAPLPVPVLWSGGMYWWYFNFLILGFESRSFRGRGGRDEVKDPPRMEWEGGAEGCAVLRHTKRECEQYSLEKWLEQVDEKNNEKLNGQRS